MEAVARPPRAANHRGRHRRGADALVTAVAAAALAGCGDDASSRALWLAHALSEDNLPWALRDPDLVAGRYLQMAASAHGFFRGSLGIWLRDQGEAGPGALPTAFGGADTALVAAVGDPHLENLGAFAPGLTATFAASGPQLHAAGAATLEWNDFDAAGYAPFTLDLRRLALGFGVVALELARAGALDARAAGDADDPARHEEQALPLAAAWARAVAGGYALELSRQQQESGPGDAPPLRVVEGDAAGIATDLLRRAREDGEAAQTLVEATTAPQEGAPLPPAALRLRRGELQPPTLQGVVAHALVELTPAERAAIGAALTDAWLREGWPGTPRLQDGGRRLGAGVGSYALFRAYALVGVDGAEDAGPYLIELKEIADAPRVRGLRWPSPRPFDDNASRVVTLQRAMQSDAARDRFFARGCGGGVCLRLRHRTAWQKGLALQRLIDRVGAGKWVLADVEALAGVAGRLLAAAHTRTPTAAGGPALPALLATLAGREAAFAAELEAVTLAALPVLHRDARLLGELLRTRGPLLGLQPSLAMRRP